MRQLSKIVNEIAAVEQQLQALSKKYKNEDFEGKCMKTVSTSSTLECDTLSIDESKSGNQGMHSSMNAKEQIPPSTEIGKSPTHVYVSECRPE